MHSEDEYKVEEMVIDCPSTAQLRGLIMHPQLAALLMKNNRIKQRTKLWYTTRARMITASDVAAVLGQNPYNSRKSVFKKKTGQSRPFRGNRATRRGTQLEPEGLAAYEKKSGKKLWPEDMGLLCHDEYPCIGGSPDGITLDGILVELKCPLSREIIPGYIPEHYVAQVQVCMEICNLETCHFVQYRPGSTWCDEVLDITVVKRDREWWARSLPVLLDFVEEVTEFYTQVNLPIGTPTIDWDKEDRQAKRRKVEEESGGIRNVCMFVTDQDTKKQKFIVERYFGPDKPMERSEHLLGDFTICEDDSTLQEANRVVKEAKQQPNDQIELDIASIMSRFSKHEKALLDSAAVPADEGDEGEDSDGEEEQVLDLEKIRLAMQKQAVPSSRGLRSAC